MTNVEKKLEQLQAGLRRQKALTVVLIAALVITYLTGVVGPLQPHYALAEEKKPQPVPRYPLLQAERFNLVDAKGALLASLMQHETSGRPVIALFDKEGDARVALTLNNEYHPLLTFQDDEHRQRLRLYLNEDFSGQLDMFDANKNAAIEIEGGQDPRLTMRRGSKYERASLYTTGKGTFFRLTGEDGRNTAKFGLDDEGAPTIELTDTQEKIVFSAPK